MKKFIVTLLVLVSFLLGNASMLAGLIRLIMKEETLTALFKESITVMTTKLLYGESTRPIHTNISNPLPYQGPGTKTWADRHAPEGIDPRI